MPDKIPYTSVMTLFATLSHSSLSSWNKVFLAHGHNARTIDVPNADPKSLGVIETVDLPGRDLTERIKNRLNEAGVIKLRKNAVIAFEDIFGASPGYWKRRFPGGWENENLCDLMQDPLIEAVDTFARRKHGQNLISISWHFDEKSPHAHVVSVPLSTRLHKTRGRKRNDGFERPPVMKTTLAASELRKGGKRALEREHDDWSRAVAHLGLKRGRRGSELTPEEVRERRLRDRQASRQGEEAAKLRRQLESHNEAARRAAEQARLWEHEARESLARAEAGANELTRRKILEGEAKAAEIEKIQRQRGYEEGLNEGRSDGLKAVKAESDEIRAKARAEGFDEGWEEALSNAVDETDRMRAKARQEAEANASQIQADAQARQEKAEAALKRAERRQGELAEVERKLSELSNRLDEQKSLQSTVALRQAAKEHELKTKIDKVRDIHGKLVREFRKIQDVQSKIAQAPPHVKEWIEPRTRQAIRDSKKVLQQTRDVVASSDTSRPPKSTANTDSVDPQTLLRAQKGRNGWGRG
ncbi:plasmid recombination protein [Pacificimonas flava]|uniref:Plasmid recombination enzyme n=1 Tax=Pacificimonas flava TaxID=1234595 RepID=M2U0T1_9SPHN|nr:plasmid recombination protein [Pacificimonas flava]EMD81627.1 hypothetical protein C725_2999 [Pacificimonas flava]MBB5281860.1 hypothetical protein [Pacificimonas flava]